VVALAILIPLAIPVLSMELGQDDAGGQPKDTYARQAFDLTTEGFGVGENGPLLVAGTLGGGAGERQADEAAVDRLHDEAARDPGVVAVTPPVYNQQRSAVYFSVIPTTRPQADETEDLVHRLRDDLISAAEKGNSLDASVGGVTAAQIDLAARIADRLPLVIAAVIALSFLLLMTAFRSLLIPLKAGLMNLLAVGAAYGVLVAVFQWGWGAELIGLEGATPITSFIPLMMFAILFGLSMDYEVFLMSQIRERHEMGEDTHDSVAHGLALSGRVITAAALIMVCVFSAFMLVGDPTIKQFGLGMAVAVAIDATIVRCLLVPSLMVLMRNGNWYFPKWLDRVLPRMNVEGEAALRDSGALNDEAALAGAKVP
jgi:RND superfamily putative drug exporter